MRTIISLSITIALFSIILLLPFGIFILFFILSDQVIRGKKSLMQKVIQYFQGLALKTFMNNS
jgi:ABC-type molybdate transport system permease subunit